MSGVWLQNSSHELDSTSPHTTIFMPYFRRSLAPKQAGVDQSSSPWLARPTINMVSIRSCPLIVSSLHPCWPTVKRVGCGVRGSGGEGKR
ncbi:hypothetical protein ElyMa_004516100 [Elysia marginata]|uniref:Uncharacterized protein n=1 Tax=Elysia marginata TaxID=1093978 RepID=A0AAV4HL91_9GAST|nr:hypothetical protein ElyMa_004516100 [Elysia marginata]